jgi:hypothetical protein
VSHNGSKKTKGLIEANAKKPESSRKAAGPFGWEKGSNLRIRERGEKMKIVELDNSVQSVSISCTRT